jgi:hypothetical protein
MQSATLSSAPAAEGQDFAVLFPPSPESDHLTARTARLLHDVLRYLGAVGHARLAQLGARPVREEDDDLFTALPEFTWSQSVPWRRRFIEVFDAIADQLAQGRTPVPSTPAEEFALWLAIVQAELLLTLQPDLVHKAVDGIASEPGDFDWPRCHARLFRHAYVPLLFLAEFDGMQDPDHAANRRLRIGDYRPAGWFTEFAAAPVPSYAGMRWV